MISLSNTNISLILIFSIIVLGYILGRINVKGIKLGSSGVFLVAVIIGSIIGVMLDMNDLSNSKSFLYTLNNMSNTFQNIGLILFITAIGYTAGPVFIKTLKSGAVNFILLSLVVIVVGLVSTLVIYFVDPSLDMPSALGLMMGALTSTPGLSSARSAYETVATTINTANAIAYPFGVLGACLFVQIMPKFFKKDLESAKEKLSQNSKISEENIKDEELFEFDKLGLTMFSLTAVLGVLIGAITIPGINFKLTTTGGCLVAGIIFSQIKRIKKVSFNVPKNTLKVLKELGLIFFLTGSGITGGFNFISTLTQYPLYFVYGIIITTLPMIIGFIMAHKVFKMDILSNLGAITGAMTSTPALGALEQVAQTDDVSACYTATYPLALFLLVIIPQIINIFI